MRAVFGISWNDKKKGKASATFAALLLTLPFLTNPSVAYESYEASGRLISVIVRELHGSGDAPERAVEDLGGRVGRHIGLVDSFVAEVPSESLGDLQSHPLVESVTPNGLVKLMSRTQPGRSALASTEVDRASCPEPGYGPRAEAGSLDSVAGAIGADALHGQGITGRGVDVAVIDSGVVPVPGLNGPGKVVNGPDLSFDSQGPEAIHHMDTFGHGTHVAGIIAGNDGTPSGNWYDRRKCESFTGIAPDSRIVNVKVANSTGATDVSQVLAAIDWVVQHRTDNGLNIRVLNLSFGTDGVQDYMVDPLTHAVEVAWHRGIVVVVAAGNNGVGNNKLNNPAYDPYVLAVGAVDTKGTAERSDDEIPSWSARGDRNRKPDLVAPGKSIVSLRAGNSLIDAANPQARMGDRFMKGTGTSQAAAVVSGAAALLLSQRPQLTPDQVKALLTSSAQKVPGGDRVAAGHGMLDVENAAQRSVPSGSVQRFKRSTGAGSLEAARGTAHVKLDGEELTGERDIFGNPWDGAAWSRNSWEGVTWSGGDYNGVTWSGAGWSGVTWSGVTWSGVTWSGVTWSGVTWSGVTWSGVTWSGVTWSGVTWSGVTWSGVTWSGVTWSGVTWSGVTWSGVTWS